MKRLLFILVLCVFAVACGGHSNRYEFSAGSMVDRGYWDEPDVDLDCYEELIEDKYNNDFTREEERLVYICTGPYAYAYHYDEDCWALQQCSESIEEVYLSDVVDEREPCSQCVW